MKRVRYIPLWVAGLSALAVCIRFLGWDELSQALHRADPQTMVGLVLLQIFTLGLTAYQLSFLLQKLGNRLPFLRVFEIHLAGGFVESVTPSVKLGGEAAKVYLLRQTTRLPHSKLAGVLLAHKYISLLPFVALCAVLIAIAMLRQEGLGPVYLTFLFLAIFFGLIAWLLRRGLKGQITAKTYDAENPLRSNRIVAYAVNKVHYLLTYINDAIYHARSLIATAERSRLIPISLLVWGLYPVKVYLVASMLGYEVNLFYIALATYTAYLVSMLPLLPGGIGTFEGTMVLVLSLGGLSPAEGLAVALMSRAVTFWFPLFLSVAVSGRLILAIISEKRTIDLSTPPESLQREGASDHCCHTT